MRTPTVPARGHFPADGFGYPFGWSSLLVTKILRRKNRKIVKIAFLGKSAMKFEISAKNESTRLLGNYDVRFFSYFLAICCMFLIWGFRDFWIFVFVLRGWAFYCFYKGWIQGIGLLVHLRFFSKLHSCILPNFQHSQQFKQMQKCGPKTLSLKHSGRFRLLVLFALRCRPTH